jgi:threonyl-tRNA synthetase
MGSDALWEQATNALINALKKRDVSYNLNAGDGAFYGPKIDFQIQDSLGRKWQCGTIQVDFFQPQNFELTYVDSDGTKQQPVIIHRAIYGSFERFFGIVLEHFKGKLPFWLAPVQIKLLTITDDQKEYAQSIAGQLTKHEIRVEVDSSSDQISGQIKTAQLAYIPLMLVIGKKEVDNNTVTIRYLDGKQEFGVTVEQLLGKTAALNNA